MQTNCVNSLSNFAFDVGAAGTFGYAAAAFFATTNPIPFAVGCIGAEILSKVISPAVDQVFNREGSTVETKFFGSVIKLSIGVALAAGATLLLGFPMTYQLGFLMFGALCVSKIALRIMKGCCFQNINSQPNGQAHRRYSTYHNNSYYNERALRAAN